MDKYNKNDYLFLIEKVKALYENSRDDNLEDFPISEREKFHKNGNRQDFEKLYFKRRDYLSAAAVLALFDKKYIHEVERIILAVCDEYCWALPAHTTGVEVDGKKVLDLFVAETSFALAEICYVFKGEISPEVYGRVQSEIKTRLLGNYVSNTYWWENCNMNWAAVCGGYAGGALLYMFPDEFLAQKTRILKTLKCYIDGFTEDGFCLETILHDGSSEAALIEEISLKQAIRALPEKERLVIQLRYFHGLTQQRVAAVLGVSQVQISRIEKKALLKLREIIS